MSQYDAQDVARYVIERCHKMARPISNLKLQKILYFLQAAFLVEGRGPLFSNTMEAWDYGPVVPDVYHAYKMYGDTNIPVTETGHYPFTKRDEELMDEYIDRAAGYSAIKLVEISHSQAPWQDAYGQVDETISPESIEKFFAQ